MVRFSFAVVAVPAVGAPAELGNVSVQMAATVIAMGTQEPALQV